MSVGVLPDHAGMTVGVAPGAYVLLLDLVSVDGRGPAVYAGRDGAAGWSLTVPGEEWRAAEQLGRRLQLVVGPPVPPPPLPPEDTR